MRLPITAGFTDFRFGGLPEVPGLREDVRTPSVVPGLELELPIGDRWLVVPFIDFGVAGDLDEDDTVKVFGLGARTYYRFPVGRRDLTVGNRTLLTGHEPLDGFPEDRFGSFENGFEGVFPCRFQLFGRESSVALHCVNYAYFDAIKFVDADDRDQKVESQNEIGITLGTPTHADIRATDIPRIGLAYREGEAGWGVRLILGLPF